MYKVTLYHFHPAYRNGDLEEDETIISCNMYKTKKLAKSKVLWEANGHNLHINWHTGNTPSWIYYYTDKKWVNENSGEELTERFAYKIEKV